VRAGCDPVAIAWHAVQFGIEFGIPSGGETDVAEFE